MEPSPFRSPVGRLEHAFERDEGYVRSLQVQILLEVSDDRVTFGVRSEGWSEGLPALCDICGADSASYSHLPESHGESKGN